MTTLGTFYGVGVGPGPQGYIPLAAWQALQGCQTIFYPKARHVESSVARQCLNGLDIPEERFRQVIYNMDPDRCLLGEHYGMLAQEIKSELIEGRNVAYLTIGDSLTYSTYSYTVEALVKLLPDLKLCTFPGITSFAAMASAFNWPLGQGKERILILPCPDDMQNLKTEIESHDIVVLMKIGHRLQAVLDLVKAMGIGQNCVFASRIGLPGEVLCSDLNELSQDQSLGYLSTMLIRQKKPEAR